LTEGEVAQVAAAFQGAYAARNRALFVLGVRTGFRISELLSVRVGDVWQGGTVGLTLTVKRPATKGRIAGRTLPLHAEARAALAD
jgi:integrase